MTQRRVRRLNFWGACLAGSVLAIGATSPAAAQTDPEGYNFDSVRMKLAGGGFARGALHIRHNDKQVLRHGFGLWRLAPSALDRPYNVASVSKTYSVVVALAAMNDPAVDMDLEDKVFQHIPNLITTASAGGATHTGPITTDPGWNDVTIRHLMVMTSGITFPTPSALPGIPNGPAPSCLGNQTVTLEECAQEIIALKRVPFSDARGTILEPGEIAPAGAQYAYSGANHTVLALAVLKAVQAAHPAANIQTFSDVAERYLFNPCDLNGNSNLSPLPPFAQRVGTRYTFGENEWAGGGVEVSLDFGARFAEVMRTGTCGSATIISPAQRVEFERNQLEIVENGETTIIGDFDRIDGDHITIYDNDGTLLTNNDSTTWPVTDNRNYGLGIWLSDYTNGPEHPTFFAIGAWGAHIFYVPSLNLSGFLLLDDESLATRAITDSIALMTAILPDIQAQAEANP